MFVLQKHEIAVPVVVDWFFESIGIPDSTCKNKY